MSYPVVFAELQTRLEIEAEKLVKHGQPAFVNDATCAALQSKRVVICGLDPEQSPLLIYLLVREHFNIIGVADDDRAGEKLLRLNVMSSFDLATSILPDDVLLINGSSHKRSGYRTFEKVAAHLNRSIVNFQQFAWLVRLAGMSMEMTLSPDFYVTSVLADRQRYIELLPVLDDDASRANLLRILLGRLTVNFDWFWEAYSPVEDMYFPDFFVPDENEILADAGAYDGQDTLRFLKKRHYRFAKACLFELDPVNVVKIEKNIAGLEGTGLLPRIDIIPSGLWSGSADLDICSEGISTFLAAVQGQLPTAARRGRAQVVSLDSAMAKATLIKLEIEGAEMPALNGAQRILKENRPNLSISAYHLTNDIPDIITFVSELDLGYRLRLRHHWGSDIRTLIYAGTRFTD